jgi:hypothetical protein
MHVTLGLATTYNIVTSEHVKNQRFLQKPQVKRLSRLRHFYLLGLNLLL